MSIELRGYQNGDAAGLENFEGVGEVVCAASSNAFDDDFPTINGFGKGNGTAHGEGLGEFGDQHPDTRPVQAEGHASC